MNTAELAAVLPVLFELRQAVFIWGPPGIGKSSVVRQVAAERGLAVRDIRLAACDPTDLRGIPFYDPGERTARWAPPEFLPRDGQGLVFLDELNAAPPAVQAAAYQLVLDRRLGEYELPPGWTVLAAGNRQSDLGVVYRMPSPLANRFCHLELDPDFEAWKGWAYRAGLAPEVVGFLGHRPELLFRLDRETAAGAFPSPRSWEFAARLVASPLPPAQRLPAVAGCVGQGPAIELLAYIEVADRLPDAEAILSGGAVQVPRELSVLYALVGTLLYGLRREWSEPRRDRFLAFLRRLPAEFAVLGVKDGLNLGFEWRGSPEWPRWVAQFGDAVL